jgi:undecaprenyl-phosphate galactose phosphotransferase
MSLQAEYIQKISDLALIRIKHNRIKRFFDLVFSCLVLILGSPIFLIISLLIFISSPGPIFYGHKRVGRGGKIIKCWKFRTMKIGADKLLKQLLKKNPVLMKEWRLYYKLKNDPRITNLGNFLRKTSLDELPQFWNVLKGELSVVGPRPCVEEEVKEHYNEKAKKILSIRPGITGIWQTSGRNNISWDYRLKLDEEYVEKQNFFKDLKLIIKTVLIIFSSKGAF